MSFPATASAFASVGASLSMSTAFGSSARLTSNGVRGRSVGHVGRSRRPVGRPRRPTESRSPACCSCQVRSRRALVAAPPLALRESRSAHARVGSQRPRRQAQGWPGDRLGVAWQEPRDERPPGAPLAGLAGTICRPGRDPRPRGGHLAASGRTCRCLRRWLDSPTLDCPTGDVRGLWFLRRTRRVRATGRIEPSPPHRGATRVRPRRS